MLQSLILSFILSVPSTKVQGGIVLMTEVEYASVDQYKTLQTPLFMDVAFPSVSPDPLPVVLFIHGGGWSGGQREDGEKFIRMLSAGGYFACSIDYRLSQTAGFPAAINDCKSAIQFLRTHADELGIDSTRIGIAGYSSGGHLAALVGLSSGDEILEDGLIQDGLSTEVLCIATVSGMVMPQYARGNTQQKYEDWALQNKGVTIQMSLPQTYADSQDPPMYLLCGSDDHIAPVKYSKKFAELVQEKGVNAQIEILPKRGHLITKAESYFGLLNFLDQHLGGHGELSVREFVEHEKKSRGSRK